MSVNKLKKLSFCVSIVDIFDFNNQDIELKTF